MDIRVKGGINMKIEDMDKLKIVTIEGNRYIGVTEITKEATNVLTAFEYSGNPEDLYKYIMAIELDETEDLELIGSFSMSSRKLTMEETQNIKACIGLMELSKEKYQSFYASEYYKRLVSLTDGNKE